MFIFVMYAYSHPRLCITTVQPTVHVTNAVIEDAKQELLVHLPLSCSKLITPIDFFFHCYCCPFNMLAGMGVDHVSLSNESTAHPIAMFKTSLNADAWHYFMMHMLYDWCILMLLEVRSGMLLSYISL